MRQSPLFGEMITCPRCSATLPPATLRCQFCGTDVSKVQRPVEQPVHRGYDAPKWVWTWYTIISVYWVCDGVLAMLRGAGVLSDSRSYVMMIIGAALITVGFGLLFKVRFLRGVAHIFCWFILITSVLDIIAGLIATVAYGPIVYFFVVFSALRAASAGFMIFLIGETESLFPM